MNSPPRLIRQRREGSVANLENDDSVERCLQDVMAGHFSSLPPFSCSRTHTRRWQTSPTFMEAATREPKDRKAAIEASAADRR